MFHKILSKKSSTNKFNMMLSNINFNKCKSLSCYLTKIVVVADFEDSLEGAAVVAVDERNFPDRFHNFAEELAVLVETGMLKFKTI